MFIVKAPSIAMAIFITSIPAKANKIQTYLSSPYYTLKIWLAVKRAGHSPKWIFILPDDKKIVNNQSTLETSA